MDVLQAPREGLRRRLMTLVLAVAVMALVPISSAAAQKADPGDETEPADEMVFESGEMVDVLLGDPADTFVPPQEAANLDGLMADAGVEGSALESSNCDGDILVNYNGFTPEAQEAFAYAAAYWSFLICTPVDIVVEATFAVLPPGTIGSAGPTASTRNFPNAPRQFTWYPIALANSLAGQDLSAGHEINARFSSGHDFYFGTDGQTPGDQVDFVSVVMHELGHGLGFFSAATVNADGVGAVGAQGSPRIYDRFTATTQGTRILDFPNPSLPLGAALTSDDLVFRGFAARLLTPGFVYPRLYAPAIWRPGSSYAHLDEATFPAGDPNSLMTPFIGRGEAIHWPGTTTLGIFYDMGWR